MHDADTAASRERPLRSSSISVPHLPARHVEREEFWVEPPQSFPITGQAPLIASPFEREERDEEARRACRR